jgi:hypothetical protein
MQDPEEDRFVLPCRDGDLYLMIYERKSLRLVEGGSAGLKCVLCCGVCVSVGISGGTQPGPPTVEDRYDWYDQEASRYFPVPKLSKFNRLQ